MTMDERDYYRERVLAREAEADGGSAKPPTRSTPNSNDEPERETVRYVYPWWLLLLACYGAYGVWRYFSPMLKAAYRKLI